MLIWYNNLYIGDTVKKRAGRICRRISRGIGQIGIYVITLAANPQDHLDIFTASQLQQKQLRQRCPMIVGIARGYEESLKVVERIVRDVWEETGTTQIRTYLLEKQNFDKDGT